MQSAHHADTLSMTMVDVTPPAQPQMPAAIATPGEGSIGPLSGPDAQMLLTAARSQKKLRSATAIAMTNAVLMAAFGILAAISGLSGLLTGSGIDVAVLALGLAICVLAWNELRGRKMLLRLETRGPLHLALNQILVGIVLIAYFGWRIAVVMLNESEYASDIAANPDIADMLGPIADNIKWIYVAFYGLIIVITAPYQLAVALYYLTRRKPLQKILDKAPPWTVDLLRRMQ